MMILNRSSFVPRLRKWNEEGNIRRTQAPTLSPRLESKGIGLGKPSFHTKILNFVCWNWRTTNIQVFPSPTPGIIPEDCRLQLTNTPSSIDTLLNKKHAIWTEIRDKELISVCASLVLWLQSSLCAPCCLCVNYTTKSSECQITVL